MFYRCLPLLIGLIGTCAPYLLLAQQHEQFQSVTKPNIVILLADDLGWGDVGYHNSDVVTPNIDTIARSGVAFDRFYVNPTCGCNRLLLSGCKYSSRCPQVLSWLHLLS